MTQPVQTLLLMNCTKKKYANLVFNCFGLYGAKMSILLLYIRIFSIQRSTRWATFTTMAFVFLTFCFAMIADAVNRAPPAGKSFDKVNLMRDETVQPTINIILGYLNLALDVLIFIIPIRASWNLQLGLTWKIKMLLIFSTGLLYGISSAYSD